MSKKNKGFTLAELLIVVAIIAVLVAISIPIFTSQLERARRAVDINNARNIRSAFASAMNDGALVFNNEKTTLFVYVSASKTDGGIADEVAYSDVKINGTNYHDLGQSKLWDFLGKYGINKNVRMKQKKSSISWYGVSIKGNGESYYYEGTGAQIGGNSVKYAWTDLDTPIK